MEKITIANFFSDMPVNSHSEVLETVANFKNARIERIISTGQATPEGEWYDQEQDEWVMLLSGSACILLEGYQGPHNLVAGDYLLIPSHCRHRVTWTDPEQKTVWLAVHSDGASS